MLQMLISTPKALRAILCRSQFENLLVSSSIVKNQATRSRPMTSEMRFNDRGRFLLASNSSSRVIVEFLLLADELVKYVLHVFFGDEWSVEVLRQKTGDVGGVHVVLPRYAVHRFPLLDLPDKGEEPI